MPVTEFSTRNKLTAPPGRATNSHTMDTQKAIDLIEKSGHIALLLPTRPTIDHLASAEVLMRALEARGKHVGFPVKPQKDVPSADFLRVSSAPALTKEFIVTLDTSRGPLAQLRYEKEDDKIHIVLSPKSSPFKEEYVSFREGKLQTECAIAIGVPSIESAADAAGLSPEFITETPAINLDVSRENPCYGEANLVNPEKSSLAEIVYEFVPMLWEEPLDKESSTLLLAGVFASTRELRSPNAGPDTLLCVSELMRLGGDKERAREMARGTLDLSLMQLIGRASVRSRLEKDRGLLWSFLTFEDFEKTGRGSEDASRVLEYVDREFPAHKFSVLLSQTKPDEPVLATFSGERAKLEALHARAGGALSNPHLAISLEERDFRSAEEGVASLLGEVL